MNCTLRTPPNLRCRQAIQPLVLGFLGLDDFRPKPAAHAKAVKPNYTGTVGGYAVTPGDLAIIYDRGSHLPGWLYGCRAIHRGHRAK